MYKSFFGLREDPFNANPDPRYLFLTKEVEEALSGLMYGVHNRKGFITLTGEVGTGKTTLVNRLLDWLHQRRARTAFLFNSRMNTNQLFDFILAEFGISCEARTKSQQLMKLNQWLLERYRAGETVVLIVDEAQNLTHPVLEEIRLLTNLETSTEKLLQIVLSGQPEFEERLRLPQLRAAPPARYAALQDISFDERADAQLHPRTSTDRGSQRGTDFRSQDRGNDSHVFDGHSARGEFAMRTCTDQCLRRTAAANPAQDRGRCCTRI